MTTLHTGQAEIDQQHQILETMIEDLAKFCPKSDKNLLGPCDECTSAQCKQCAEGLSVIAKDLTAFHIGHSTYEERMMELLPPTTVCHAHIKAHKAAHEGMLKQLKKYTPQFIKENLATVAGQLKRLLTDWLGDHVVLFDNHLVGLSSPNAHKINFDSELVAMLDAHVFPNRPTHAKRSAKDAISAQKKKLEVRGRFETLSPTQRKVFWLVISGKTNPAIAQELGVSVNTIKSHRSAIFQKMDIQSAIELVKLADILR